MSGSGERAGVPPIVWNFDELKKAGLEAYRAGGTPTHPMIEDRIVAVYASPAHGTSERMAAGVSVVPAGYSTPAHSHVAEEYAHVLEGSGVITIDDVAYAVGVGDIVLTPSHSVHVTTAGETDLVIWWIYGPAGSESRWLDAAPE